MCDSDSSISSTENVEDDNQLDFDSDSTVIIETNSECISNKYTLLQDIRQFTESELDVNNLVKSNDASSQILNKNVKPITHSEKDNVLDKSASSFVHNSSSDDDIHLDVDAIIKKYTSTGYTLPNANSEYNNVVPNNNHEPIEISSDEDDLPRIKIRSVTSVPKSDISHDKDVTEICSSNDYFNSQTSSFKSASSEFKETKTLMNTELNENLCSTSGTSLASIPLSFNCNDVFANDCNDDLFTQYGIRCDSDNDDVPKIPDITEENSTKNKSGNRKRKLNDDTENKRLVKAAERIKKREEAEQAKLLKQALQIANKNMKPEECIKFITVMLDTEIMNERYGGEILNALQGAEVTYKLQSQLIPYTITWNRKLQTHFLDENEKLIPTSEIVETDEVLLIMNWKQIIELIHNRSLLAHIKSLQSVKCNKKLFLVIYGLENYFRYHKNKKQQEVRSEISQNTQKNTNKHDKNFKDVPKIGKKQLQFALTELQILCSCCHRLIDGPQDLAMMILQFTKSIAQASYKLEKHQKQEAEWYICGDNKDCVRVDKNGNGLQRLWQQQLTTFPLARLEHAEAIITQYSTPLSLMEAYDNCTKMQGEKLLQDIQIRRAAGPLTNVRKIGPELSKKIYTFFTSVDGNSVL
ncbi:hypothetical protein ILUMI_25454 [Ignelater luminosus]|uniref:Crossover junction endonuclease EME1 n=1 Tax=Ignelater luminosus TaxID=2038154 RepID=A0A8K0C8H2_IGNLU|nr:hypothetical protein ILUMI_25454 [Ignelater luminosus]